MNKNTGQQTIGMLFHKWLFIFTVAAFAAAFFTTQFLQRRQAENEARISLESEIVYVKGQISDYQLKADEQKRFAKEALLSKAAAAAKIISESPEILSSRKAVAELAGFFSIGELNISDDRGTILRSTLPELENAFNYRDHSETAAYMNLINGKAKSIVEEPRLNTIRPDGIEDWKQYAGVPRLDKKGIVQIGYASEQYNKTMSSVSIASLATNYYFQNTGCLFILDKNKDGKIISSTSGKDRDKTPSEAGFSSFTLSPRYERSAAVSYNGMLYMARYDYLDSFFILTMLPYAEIYRSGNRLMILISLFYFILFTAIYFMISGLLDHVVIRGFDETNRALDTIVGGNLNCKVQVETTKEFASLSKGINTTVAALNKAITEAAHRMDKDLELARAIQLSALPSVFPPFPEHTEFDLFATMKTAREVGGDFYDFFLIGTDRLGFVIADVSGKGIPASLFMMSAKTQLKNCMMEKEDLKEAVELANNSLCENNEAGMFVTAFAGILNYRTGELKFVNGGHNYPLIRSGGTYRWLTEKSGLFLGVFTDCKYKEHAVTLLHGDIIFLYTDGITEAMNRENALYGNDRLAACLNSLQEKTPVGVLPAVAADVARYTDGAPQADDITMLAVLRT